MNINNIVFDIGGVLAKPKSGNWFITPNFWNIIDKSEVNQDELNNSIKKYMYLHTQNPKTELEEHNMFSNYYYNVLNEIKYPNLTKEIASKLADDCVYNDDKFFFYEDDKTNLEKLSKDYNLYIISNGWPSSFRVLKNNNMEKYFKGIIISSMYTTIKEEKLFNVFLDKYKNIIPKETIYIDDRTYILDKAKNYGFNLLLMDREKNYLTCKYKKIKNMIDLIKILEET